MCRFPARPSRGPNPADVKENPHLYGSQRPPGGSDGGWFWSSHWEAVEWSVLLGEHYLVRIQTELFGQCFLDWLTASVNQRQTLPEFPCKLVFASVFGYRLFHGTFTFIYLLEPFQKILRAHIMLFTQKSEWRGMNCSWLKADISLCNF